MRVSDALLSSQGALFPALQVLDAGFKVRELQEAGLSRCVVRLPVDFTGRRNTLLP